MYRYVLNGPTNYIDPSGFCEDKPDGGKAPPDWVGPAFDAAGLGGLAISGAGEAARSPGVTALGGAIGTIGQIGSAWSAAEWYKSKIREAVGQLEAATAPLRNPGGNGGAGGSEPPDSSYCAPSKDPVPPPKPETDPGDDDDTGAVGGFDPNQKLGPDGFGASNFISGDVSLPYRIDFENDARATAPAQQVIITDLLSSNLDWPTFALAEVSFGDNILSIPANVQHFQATVPVTYNAVNFNVEVEAGINLTTGMVFAYFFSVDPKTGLPPDVLIGFLPPENGTGRGQGHISYAIRPESGLTTGTQIRNVALISFDGQPQIATNQIDPHDFSRGTDPTKEALVTIDAGTTLIANSVTPTESGFIAHFNKPLNTGALNLYDTQTGGLGAADVTLVGANQGAIAGSLVLNSSGDEITFIKTGGVLLPDIYTITMRSAANAFSNAAVGALDGNANGVNGDTYTSSFTVAPSNAVVVSIPDFTRGAGQPADIPATSTQLPITLSSGAGVTSVTLTLIYNPALLTITDVTAGAALPIGSLIQKNLGTPGQVQITISSPTALGAGVAEIVKLVANVPTGAIYRGAEILDVTNVTINDGAIAAIGDDGLHVAAYFGDTTGNGSYSALDGQRVLRVAAGLDSGFAAFPLIDPIIIGDITGNFQISALDGTRVLQFAAGIPTPQIPPLPAQPTPEPHAATEVPMLTNDVAVKSSDVATVTNSLSNDTSNRFGNGLTLDLAQSAALSKQTGKEWLFYTN